MHLLANRQAILIYVDVRIIVVIEGQQRTTVNTVDANQTEDVAIVAEDRVGVPCVQVSRIDLLTGIIHNHCAVVVARDQLTVTAEEHIVTIRPFFRNCQTEQVRAATDDIVLTETTTDHVFAAVAFNVIIAADIRAINSAQQRHQVGMNTPDTAATCGRNLTVDGQDIVLKIDADNDEGLTTYQQQITSHDTGQIHRRHLGQAGQIKGAASVEGAICIPALTQDLEVTTGGHCYANSLAATTVQQTVAMNLVITELTKDDVVISTTGDHIITVITIVPVRIVVIVEDDDAALGTSRVELIATNRHDLAAIVIDRLALEDAEAWTFSAAGS